MALNSNEKPGSAKQPDASKSPLSVEELRDWIAQYLATHAGVAPSALNPTERFKCWGWIRWARSQCCASLGRV